MCSVGEGHTFNPTDDVAGYPSGAGGCAALDLSHVVGLLFRTVARSRGIAARVDAFNLEFGHCTLVARYAEYAHEGLESAEDLDFAFEQFGMVLQVTVFAELGILRESDDEARLDVLRVGRCSDDEGICQCCRGCPFDLVVRGDFFDFGSDSTYDITFNPAGSAGVLEFDGLVDRVGVVFRSRRERRVAEVHAVGD